MSAEQTTGVALRLAIDRTALADNWRAMDRLSGSARAGAAVKADGYGIGAWRAVETLHEVGCRDFFVAHWSEVAEIAGLVDPADIAVLHGPLTTADCRYAMATGVKPVINSLRQARLWREAGGGVCDLMIDTGINRLGLPMAELGDEAVAALKVDVLHSHLASADEDVPSNQVQLKRWQHACGVIAHRRASLANSAGIALGKAYHGELTRPGLALYGGVSRSELADVVRQVATPQAAIMQVRQLAAGDTVGYNATFTAPAAMRVGVIALGYADGYLRCWSGVGGMLSGAARLAVLGRVSMDMTVIDLTDAPDLHEGDWIDAEYDLRSASQITGLSQYELLTLLGRRFGR